LLDFAQCYDLLLSFIRREQDKSIIIGQAGSGKGFKDFEQMRKDADLESIREDPRFKSLSGG
jgi:hypothetical protein